MDRNSGPTRKVLALARKVKSYADPNAKKDQNYNTTMEVKLTNGKIYKAFDPTRPARRTTWWAGMCCELSFAKWPARC